jgi:hypothetical protein
MIDRGATLTLHHVTTGIGGPERQQLLIEIVNQRRVDC